MASLSSCAILPAPSSRGPFCLNSRPTQCKSAQPLRLAAWSRPVITGRNSTTFTPVLALLQGRLGDPQEEGGDVGGHLLHRGGRAFLISERCPAPAAAVGDLVAAARR